MITVFCEALSRRSALPFPPLIEDPFFAKASKSKPSSSKRTRTIQAPPSALRFHLGDLFGGDADGSVKGDAGAGEHGGEEVALVAFGVV